MTSNRPLTTIMFTDIVGYTSLSSLSESDEVDILELNSRLHEYFIIQYRGTKLEEIGDGTLATFEKSIDAANCAIAMQQYVTHFNKYQLRIGLHVGDVKACSNDGLGNSVSISARIQGAAEPDSIAISEVLYRAISHQLAFNFREIGDVYLKGSVTPFPLYEILYGPIKPKYADLKRLNYTPLPSLFSVYKVQLLMLGILLTCLYIHLG